MKSIFKIFPLFLILFFLKLEGQEYDRTWGTYMGPAGTSIGPHFSKAFISALFLKLQYIAEVFL